MLVDSFGRKINYLRVSVTDRCNLRCLYCMPREGVKQVSHNEVLRFEEILDICSIFASMGISTVRVTGGEPLVRRGIADFIKKLKNINGIKNVGLTTNGVLLNEHLTALTDAGLDSINISLDTLNREKYKQLTGADSLTDVLSIIDHALELGLKIKINCVPFCGFNEDEISEFINFAKNKNITVRFIELMPLGAAAAFKPLPIEEVESLVNSEIHHAEGNTEILSGYGPASYFSLPGSTGQIGFISTSRNICKSCNRVRLTSSGLLKPCLFSDIKLDLRTLIRSGTDELEIQKAMREVIELKPHSHSFIADNTHNKKEMFRIGG